MPKKRSYDKLQVYEALHGRIQLCIVDPQNPHKDVATIFGKQPRELKHAKLLCEAWNAVVSVAERLNADPLQVAEKLQRGKISELV